MRFLFFLLLPVLFIASCGKDDDGGGDVPGTERNTVTFNGNDFDLRIGLLEDFGPNTDGVSYDWDVTLATAEVPSGDWASVYLDLNTNLTGGIVSGTYDFAEDRAPFTVVTGSATLVSVSSGTSIFIGTGGRVVVDRDGDTYDISFELTDFSGERMVGNYRGPLVLD